MSDAPGGLINDAVVGVDYAAPGEEEPEARKASTAPPPRSAAYDPGEHTVEEVAAYLDKHPGQADAVLAAERAGKNRVTLTGEQERTMSDVTVEVSVEPDPEPIPDPLDPQPEPSPEPAPEPVSPDPESVPK